MRVLTVNPSRRTRRAPPVHEATGGHAVNTLMPLNKSSIFYGYSDGRIHRITGRIHDIARKIHDVAGRMSDRMEVYRGRWTPQMLSDGHDFTIKVWPMVF